MGFFKDLFAFFGIGSKSPESTSVKEDTSVTDAIVARQEKKRQKFQAEAAHYSAAKERGSLKQGASATKTAEQRDTEARTERHMRRREEYAASQRASQSSSSSPDNGMIPYFYTGLFSSRDAERAESRDNDSRKDSSDQCSARPARDNVGESTTRQCTGYGGYSGGSSGSSSYGGESDGGSSGGGDGGGGGD